MRGCKGLTLVEVMIAAAVLMIVITGLVGSFVALGSLRESAKNLTLAVNDAAKVMEEIHGTKFTNLRNPASSDYCDANGGTTWETKVNVTNASTYLSIAWDNSSATKDESIDIVCCDATKVTNTGLPCTEGNNGSLAPDANTDLIDVYITVSWREGRGAGRIIGEDANLDAKWESGEDTMTGGTANRLDSPAQLVSKVTDRGT